MTVKISHTADIQKFFEEAAGFGNDDGSPRIKRIIQRVLQDTARLIEDLEITEDEFWLAVDYLNRLGGRGDGAGGDGEGEERCSDDLLHDHKCEGWRGHRQPKRWSCLVSKITARCSRRVRAAKTPATTATRSASWG